MVKQLTERSQTPSLQAVAQEAGVATSTVSRFVKGQLQLAEATEQRVLEAMAALGYERSTAARTEIQPRVGAATIAILVPEFDSYYSRFAKLAVAAAEQVGLLPLVISVGLTSLQASAYLRTPALSDLAGVISIGTLHNGDVRRFLAKRGIPLVAIDENASPANAPTHRITVDNYSGSRQVVTFLTRLGHSEIAFVSGPREHAAVKNRRRGYEDGLAAAGLDNRKQFDLEGVCSEDFGFAALTSLLSFDGPRPTAVYAAADEIAVGLLSAAADLRLRVPEDLTVVGFDDIAVARRSIPTLTTVRTPIDMLADAAVSTLFELIAGERADSAPETLIPVSLVVRESSGPPSI